MVIVVISVACAIIAPRLMSSLPATELKNAALELKFLLWETQQRAIAEGKIWAVAFDNGQNKYLLYYCDDEQYFNTDGNGFVFVLGDLINVGDNVSVISTTFARVIDPMSTFSKSVRFNSFGEPNEGGSIVLGHVGSSSTCTVTVASITGKVAMTMPTS